ncbi:MAG TPA: 16S rRNA (cytidine(1402)-2'-O)-methyltransferase [Gammaproteobacteria bacterium]
MNQGTLYIVATPIGNLSDISQRALEVLRQVDLVAAEDTRHSKPLLHHYGIDKAMLAYHEHNEEQLTPKLVQRLLDGESIALISDAGTPLLSDPGYRLVKMAHEAGLRVSPVPGACAAIAALSASGLATDRFLFAGFPPHKQGARQRFYEGLHQQTSTLIFYESSHRVLDSVTDMRDVFGAERAIVLAREISKTFETIHSTTLGALPEWIAADANQQKGEFVLVVQGAIEQADALAVELEHVLGVLLEELPVKQAAQMAARITGLKKNQVYQRALQLAGK